MLRVEGLRMLQVENIVLCGKDLYVLFDGSLFV